MTKVLEITWAQLGNPIAERRIVVEELAHPVEVSQDALHNIRRMLTEAKTDENHIMVRLYLYSPPHQEPFYAIMGGRYTWSDNP